MFASLTRPKRGIRYLAKDTCLLDVYLVFQKTTEGNVSAMYKHLKLAICRFSTM
jgi:hypothetical protein